MIAANELRIGNWFIGGWDGNTVMQVTGDHLSIWFGGSNMAQFPKPEPISITPEILLACGFRKEQYYFIKRLTMEFSLVWGREKKGMVISGADNDYDAYLDHILNLHDLQNLYYCLTQQELIYKP